MMKKIELNLSSAQRSMWIARLEREFCKRCDPAVMYRKIDAAATVQELEAIAKRYGFCDAIDLSAFALHSARKIMRIFTRAVYEFPKIVGRINYVGAYGGYEELLRRMSEGDAQCVRSLGLQHILSSENAKTLGNFGLEFCKELWEEADTSLAAFVALGGYCNGFLFDSADYKDYAYLDTIATLRENERMGFHPKGCNSFESVAYHEIGHILDSVCNFSFSEEGKKFLKRYSAEEIESELSGYALTSMGEIVAEAVSEVFSSSAPRKIASEIFERLQETYQNL